MHRRAPGGGGPVEDGDEVEEDGVGKDGGESEGLNAKARDVCKTDVGLCPGNGPRVALLA